MDLLQLRAGAGRRFPARRLSAQCVKFLLKPGSGTPAESGRPEHLAAVDHKVMKVADGRELEKAVADAGAGLEMLIEIVNSLRIETPPDHPDHWRRLRRSGTTLTGPVR